MFLIFILYGISLCRSVLLACLLRRIAERGEVLQYLTRSALSLLHPEYLEWVARLEGEYERMMERTQRV